MKKIFVKEIHLLCYAYQMLGCGDEGDVYKYDDETSFKIYRDECLTNEKAEKIRILTEEQENNFIFPNGYAFVENIDTRETLLRGETFQTVHKNEIHRDMDELGEILDLKTKIDICLKASKALERIHKKGYIIGDVKGQNILIDKFNEPQYIDTSNYMFKDYNFDLLPSYLMDKFKSIFNCEIGFLDIDKFLFGILTIEILLENVDLLNVKDPGMFFIIIDNLNIDNHSKNLLKYIFSDSFDKPYITDVLESINQETIMDKAKIKDLKITLGTK